MPLGLACAAEEPALSEEGFVAALEACPEWTALCARARARWLEAALSGAERGQWSRIAWILERSPAYRDWFPKHPENAAKGEPGLALSEAEFSDLQRLAREGAPDAGKPEPEEAS